MFKKEKPQVLGTHKTLASRQTNQQKTHLRGIIFLKPDRRHTITTRSDSNRYISVIALDHVCRFHCVHKCRGTINRGP